MTAPLPTPSRPGTLAAVARQITSIRSLGIDVEVLQIDGIRRLKYAQSLWRLTERASRVDLIHAHYGYCGLLSRLQRRRPVVVSFMGSDLFGIANAAGRITATSRLAVELDRRLARVVDAVIVKSQQMAEVVRPVRAHVIPNGVDLDAFRPVDRFAARRSLGWNDDSLRVLFPGNPALPNKGFALAQAAATLASAALRSSIEIIPLRGIGPEQVPLYMNACDALLMTSSTEGSPNAVKEAMACNLPIVSVGVGDVPELVQGVKACAVCSRDPRSLSAALSSILETGVRSDGRETIERRGLDLATVARQVATVYEDVLRR